MPVAAIFQKRATKKFDFAANIAYHPPRAVEYGLAS
jgi:hypothetical protein